MKKCVVTGGNGFIGSHMCRHLSDNGWDIAVIDNHSTSPKFKTHNFGTFYNLDIASIETMYLLKEYKPDFVFHFAALASVPESELHPTKYFNENVLKSITLVNNCIEAKIPNFIFSSSCATFGIPTQADIDETHSQNPINTYGKTKLIIEHVLQDLASKKLINALILRYFNAAGCSPDGLLGEHNLTNDRLIPNLCAALNSNSVFNIYGDQFGTPDGTCIRDYIHVEDLVRTHLEGAFYLADKKGFLDFNLGSGIGYSVKEVFDTFVNIARTNLKIQTLPPRPGDPSRLVANTDKAIQELNFQLKYSLTECIAHAINFNKIHT